MSGFLVQRSEITGALVNTPIQGELPALPMQKPELAQLHERLGSLLQLPESQWNVETLKKSLIEIGRAILGDLHDGQDFDTGYLLTIKAKTLSDGNDAIERVIKNIGHVLDNSERIFDAVKSHNRYEGDELTSITKQVFASQLLSPLAISAATTGDFKYLASSLESSEPRVQLAAYNHMANDLTRELNRSGERWSPEIREGLKAVLIDAQRSIVERDIEGLVRDGKLRGFQGSELKQLLDSEPGKIESRLVQMHRENNRPNVVPALELPSAVAESGLSDIPMFRLYAMRELASSVHGVEKVNALQAYVMLKR